MSHSDLTSKIMAWECGEMEDINDVIDFFADLVKTGLAFRLQGDYGRQAAVLIERGYINNHGVVLKYIGK
jgi:hypothetical protein